MLLLKSFSFDRSFISRIFVTRANMHNLIQSREIVNSLRLVYDHAVESVNTVTLMKKELQLENGHLVTRLKKFQIHNNCYLIGFGKAVLGMAYQTEKILGDHLRGGILSIPIGQKEQFDSFRLKDDSVIKIFEGAEFNIPDENSLSASNHIKSLAESLKSGDILIVLISGGGSSLLTCPIPPVTLQDKVEVIRLLQNCGADIKELNCIRKRLSQLKGGKLLDLAYPAEVISFILSDIVGDPIDYIASGPTVYNIDGDDEPLNILQKYSLINKLPKSVLGILKSPVSNSSTKREANNLIIGSNRVALSSASCEANRLGYCSVIMSSRIEGLVSLVSQVYIDTIILVCEALNDDIGESSFKTKIIPILKSLQVDDSSIDELVNFIFKSNETKFCLLFGGETTVEVRGKGIGGRNQQLALEFSFLLENRISEMPWVDKFRIGFLSGGTDGIDGPTDAAGAIAYSGQLKSTHALNLDARDFITNNDSYSFYKKLNNGEDLIFTGHTGTNVMDIHVMSIEKLGN